jgi:UDP-glucose 4-epimerase
MILLKETSAPGRITALFGQGLIGSAIVHNMVLSGHLPIQLLKVDWESFRVDAIVYRVIEDCLNSTIKQARTCSSDDRFINIVWAAGKAGFSSDEVTTEADLNSFSTLLKLVEKIHFIHPSYPIRFFHFSSAGGLFEGQSCISPDTIPCPIRPYGRMKLNQEKALLSCSINMQRTIYRPSSVYGKIRLNNRLGLIPTMVLNGLRQTETSIYGVDTTLRDFVWVEDLARHVTEELSNPVIQDSITTLHSGRPVSLYEVRTTIERLLNKRLFVRFCPDQANSLNITFSHRCSIGNGRTTSLQAAVQQILVDYYLSRPDF